MTPASDLCRPCRAAYDRWLPDNEAPTWLVLEVLAFIRACCPGAEHGRSYAVAGENNDYPT